MLDLTRTELAIILFALRYLRSNMDCDTEDSLEERVPDIKGSSLSTDKRLELLSAKLGGG